MPKSISLFSQDMKVKERALFLDEVQDQERREYVQEKNPITMMFF